MDRPLRSVLDIRIGTIVKAYLIYVAIGLVIFLIGLVIVLSVWHHSTHGAAGHTFGAAGSSNVLSWSSGAGDAITDTQYAAVRTGSPLATTQARFGTPASSGPNPVDLVTGADQKCFGYRSSTSEGKLYVFCFADGRLVAKQRW